MAIGVPLLLCGVVLFASGWLQYRLLNGLSLNEKRAQITALYIPAIIGAVIVLGTTFFSFADFFAETSRYRKQELFEEGMSNVFFALIFSAMLIFKSVLGPLIGGMVISYSLWKYADEGELLIFPAMEWTIALLISNTTTGLAVGYTAVFMIVTMISALYRSGGKVELSDIT